MEKLYCRKFSYARVVDNLINNGAILIGKTITAEFAVHFFKIKQKILMILQEHPALPRK